MTPEEIEERLKELNVYENALTRLGNEIWEEKTNLRDEYRKLTGKEI